MGTILFLVKTVSIKKYYEIFQEETKRKPFASLTQKSLQEKENQELFKEDKGLKSAQDKNNEIKKLVA